jgi:methionine sulfoxide reductase heme-binding subunit
MSVRYVGVQWNRFKLAYDAVAVLAIVGFIAAYRALLGRALSEGEQITPAIAELRSLGLASFVLLSVVLAIGPLVRLVPTLAPLLYNRRHLGVVVAGLGAMHAYRVIGYYNVYGSVGPLDAFLNNDVQITNSSLPFQLFGACALLILTVMAVTSHDFWQRLLGARRWKALHMSVYAAYLMVVVHVAFGALQDETHPLWTSAFAAVVLGVAVLHVAAARRARRVDRAAVPLVEHDGSRWLDAGALDALPVDRARALVGPSGERIALIRSKGAVSALHGVCAHQGGPLDEGRVIDGCLTCPWHGWQYRPSDGCSPPPFTEQLPTYRVRLVGGRVLVDPRAAEPGHAPAPALENATDSSAQAGQPASEAP